MDRFSLIFTPFLPWPVIAGLGVVALIVVGLALFARQRGGWVRLAAFGLMLLALANPAFVTYDRDKLNDVVAVVVDRTGSQRLADRTAQSDRARDELMRIEGPLKSRLSEAVGDSVVEKNIKTWRAMLKVLDSGEHCPTHLHARKPEG